MKLTVMDQHGAVIPNAEITLKKQSDAEQLSGLTGPTGEWSTAKVSPGEYAITIKSKGFHTFTGAISIQDGMLLGLKLKLPIAEVNTTVTVEAAQGGVMGGISTFVKNPNAVPSVSSGGQHFPIRP
ncbi:MAG TPA: carboxypeptidase-like regulatory domain-containing protein [Candidatus Angelobacter sp.]